MKHFSPSGLFDLNDAKSVTKKFFYLLDKKDEQKYRKKDVQYDLEVFDGHEADKVGQELARVRAVFQASNIPLFGEFHAASGGHPPCDSGQRLVLLLTGPIESRAGKYLYENGILVYPSWRLESLYPISYKKERAKCPHSHPPVVPPQDWDSAWEFPMAANDDN